MASCKDCIHCDVCDGHSTVGAEDCTNFSVYCKDCKNWLKLEPSGTNCRVCAVSTRIRLPYDFCSIGKIKLGV